MRHILISLILIPIPLYVISVPELPTNVFELLTTLAGVTYLTIFFSEVRFSFVRTLQSMWPLLLLIPIALGGVFASEELISSLGRLKSYFLVPLFLGGILISYVHIYSPRIPIWLLTLSGTLIGSWAIGETIWGSISVGELIRPNTIYDWNVSANLSRGGFANFIGLYLTPLFPLAGGLAYTGHSKSERRLATIATLCIGGGIFASQSYAAISVACISVIAGTVLLIKQNPIITRKLGISLGLLIVFFLGFTLTQLGTDKFQQLTDFSERNSFTSRIQIWHVSTVMISENPLVGIGLADYQRVYENTVPELYFPPHEWLVPEPHNLYFAHWLHLGVLGVLLLLSLLIQAFRIGAQAWHKEDWLMLSVALGFGTIYVYGLVDTPFWKNDLALIFVVLYLLLRHYSIMKKDLTL